MTVGLDSRTIAIVELAVLAAAWLAWTRRGRQGERDVPEQTANDGRRPPFGSILLAGIGVALAMSGVAVARLSAEQQAYGGFVQFWSLPASPTSGAVAGVRNATGATLECDVAIDRPDRTGLRLTPGSIAPGQTVVELLPQADADETAPWRLQLTCTGAGDPITRQVSIEPPR
jgi:hypothetical protein